MYLWKIYDLIRRNDKIIRAAKPGGRPLPDIPFEYLDAGELGQGVFDSTKLFVGSQGTLGIINDIKVRQSVLRNIQN